MPVRVSNASNRWFHSNAAIIYCKCKIISFWLWKGTRSKSAAYSAVWTTKTTSDINQFETNHVKLFILLDKAEAAWLRPIVKTMSKIGNIPVCCIPSNLLEIYIIQLFCTVLIVQSMPKNCYWTPNAFHNEKIPHYSLTAIYFYPVFL